MDCKDRKGGKHGPRSSRVVHGAPYQGLDSVTTVKCQNSQVSGIGSRSKGDPFHPDVPTHILVCQHMRGTLCQMVKV
jgi:hypothetical protein